MTTVLCRDCLEKAGGTYGGLCVVCGAPLCPKHAHFYVDESNIAITNSARPHCKEHAEATRG